MLKEGFCVFCGEPKMVEVPENASGGIARKI